MSQHVIYARKSSESEDRQVLSIDSQINELTAIAMRRGLRVAEVLEESHSAKAPGRPVFSALMRRVRRGEIARILCWKMDRLSRNHLDTGSVLQALADGDLHEVITSDRTYTRDGNDRFMGNFELGMATKYIDDLRANVKRGNRARFQRGWVNHNPPLGYLLDPATKTIVKDPERFDLVRRMWELLLTGAYRPERILTTANEDWGFRMRQYKRMGGGPLSRTTLYKVFANPFYMGLIRLRAGETYVGAHPPMISREEFDRAQVLLGRPGRERPQRHTFPFTGLIHCGNCGGMLTGEEHVKPSGRKYVYYRCSRHKKGFVCREPAITAPDLEGQVAQRLAQLAIPEKILAWLSTRAERAAGHEKERRESARATLETSRASLERELETLLSLRLRDLVDDAAYVARRKKIDDERERLLAKLAGPERSGSEVTQLTLSTLNFATQAATVFRSGTAVQKRMILESVGLNYALKARKMAFQLKTPFRMISEAGVFSNWSACADDVRTWLQDTTEYFKVPNLDLKPDDVSVPALATA